MTEHDIELAKQAGAFIHDMSLAHESIRKNSYLFPTDFHLNQFIELIRAEKQGEYEEMKKGAAKWSGVSFPIEQAIKNGCCPFDIEDAYENVTKENT